ncbi:MAG TPA: glycosyl hydrolase 53 family protein [Caulobacterales bacterium]|nr:glycosyl hydrolase 53 family protein [Caulobacterales bacterium]
MLRTVIVALALVMGLANGAHAQTAPRFYFGADLSFANEMDDCGAVYRDRNGPRDVYEIFSAAGHNLARIRIWNNATWTHYSNLDDVRRSIRRAHAAGMQVLLDFHYSDDWADGDKQIVPAAWADLSDADAEQALYRYTFDTLTALDRDGLMPEMVQVGNEINKEILAPAEWQGEQRPINWTRNAALINAGIRAVREASAHAAVKPLVMLHIAQPENVEPWFQAATAAGVRDFDLIGISYYRKWSTMGLDGLGQVINRLRFRYPGVGIIAVETAYPWTTAYNDPLPNILGPPETLLEGYPATQRGQEKYFIDFTQAVINAGGVGVVSWAPDWVSTHCTTRWGRGSSWENAAFFDFRGRVLPAASFAQHAYTWPVNVTLRFEHAPSTAERLYLWADFFGARDFVAPLVRDASGAFIFSTRLQGGRAIQFQVYDRLPLGPPLLTPTNPVSRAVVAQVGREDTTLTFQIP